MTIVPKILYLAADLVDRGWCRLWLAATAANVPCDSRDPEAVAFCAVGALERASEDLGCPDAAIAARDALKKVLPEAALQSTTPIPTWNDACLDAREVSSLMRRAARETEELEAALLASSAPRTEENAGSR